MRNALSRLAPCAVFACSLASAQQAVPEKASTGSSANAATPVTGMGAAAPTFGMPGGANSGPSLAPTGLTAAPAPVIEGTAAQILRAASVPAPRAAALPVRPVAAPMKAGAAAAKPSPLAASKPGAAAKEAPSASTVLDKAARDVASGGKEAAGGGDPQAVRRALDRAYDSSTRPGDVGGATPNSVAGRYSTARERVASVVDVANNSAPADAPRLYASAVETAAAALPAEAAAAVTKAVLVFAARKAEVSLSQLAQAAYAAASAGQAAETHRLVKSLDQWEELLGAPGRPLISNGEQLKRGVERALAGFDASAAPGSAPRVWVVKRGGSYAAALPGSTVEKVPGLAAGFALKLESAAWSPLARAYRDYAARPGVRTAVAARTSMGESVPSAVLSTGWLWIKHMIARAWSALMSLIPGRSLPTVANASTLPRLRDAARAWNDAVRLGSAAARAARLPDLTVSRARGAFALALRAATAHEALTGRAGAVSRVRSLSSEFEAGAGRASLSPGDRLTPGVASIVSGDGGLAHWASLHAVDAREHGQAFARVRGAAPVVILGDGPAAVAAPALAAASREMSFTAFGDALWASGVGAFGVVKLSADMRSTENGGSVALETERGDQGLAAALDELGFSVIRKGGGLRARLDAETASADPREMTELVAEAAGLISGAPLEPAARSEGLERLLADMKRAPKDAAKAAVLLSGSSLRRARTVGWVGEDEAVAIENRTARTRVIALLDSATGLAKFARVEPLRSR